MTANIDVTPGTGKTVATDEVGGFQVQQVKVMLGNSTTGVRQSISSGATDTGTQRVILATDDPAVTALAAAVQAVAKTDGSSTIATGGVAQNLFSGTTPPNGYEVVNPDASEDLWISDTTTAAANATGCIRVAANGGSYNTPGGCRPGHAVSIIGATSAHKFTARYW